MQVGPDADEPGGRAPTRAATSSPPPRAPASAARCTTTRVAALRAAGFAEATLWVFADNGHAREFYARARLGGRTAGAAEGAGAPELRYRRTLLMMIRPVAAADVHGDRRAAGARLARRATGHFVDDAHMPTVADRVGAVARRCCPGRRGWPSATRAIAGVVGVADGEVRMLYVDPAAQGAASARRCCAHAEDALRTGGPRPRDALDVPREPATAARSTSAAAGRPDGAGARDRWPGVAELRYRRVPVGRRCSSR